MAPVVTKSLIALTSNRLASWKKVVTKSRISTLIGHVQAAEAGVDIEDLSRCTDVVQTTSQKPQPACGSCGGCSGGSTSSQLISSGFLVPAAVVAPFTTSKSDDGDDDSNTRRPGIVTTEEYIDSLRGRKLKVILHGNVLDEFVDHPIVRPSINSVAETYQLAIDDPDLGTAIGFAGIRTSRFLHVAESTADLVKQSLMQRELGRRTGSCFQRCVGMDAINAMWATTYDVDAKYGTMYHQRFRKFVGNCQQKNVVIGGAMTDPKGDRSKPPSKQEDEDLFLHVDSREADGSLTLRGAKMHQTGVLNSHYMIVMPGGRLEDTERKYAIACAVPVDAAGITYIYGRQSCDLRAMEDTDIDQGNAKYGGQEAVVTFEDVHVPAEFVFMDGEFEFAQQLVERFTAYHRRSYICKAGLGDVMLGAAATISDYNGTAKASHVKHKLVEIAYLNENIAGTALAASYGGKPTAAGNFLPDVLMANICKHNVTRFPYEIARLAQDLAGGLLVTLPADTEFKHDIAGPLLEKYLKTKANVTVENRRRILRLIENMTMGRNAVGYLSESMHGAGSPQAQRVLIERLMDLETKRALAKRLAGISEA